ncbi:MAG: hypothetical protein Q9226_000892 [Calogaya cf. arnoldii]
MSFNSLNSLNPFQASRSNVSSPGSLYLSPPISTPSFMSPPPRLEAEDYLNSSVGKKKYSSRSGAMSKSSPVVLQGLPVHRPAVPISDERPHPSDVASNDEVENIASASNVKAAPHSVPSQTQQHRWLPSPFLSTTDIQKPLHEIERSSMSFPQEINESPAIMSLRRLSDFREDPIANISSEVDRSPQQSRGVFEFSFRKSGRDSPDSQRSDDDQTATTPWYSIRRRSTAPQDRDKQQPRKDETSTAILGLDIPAIITLRKATGLFQIGPDLGSNGPAFTDQVNRTREGSTTSTTTCTLVDFDSRSLGNPDSNSGPFTSNLSSKRPINLDKRGQSSAETAVTVSNIFPSPAILASPVSVPSSVEAQRRFSVVHIKSRRSLHRVIWREDDTSSSNETSSKSSSPTRPASVNLPDTSENGPGRLSPAGSKPDLRHTFSPIPPKPGALTPNGPVTAAKLETLPGTPPEGQMLQWSWAAAEDAPYDPMDSSEAAKSLHCAVEKLDEAKDNGPFGTIPAIPRLLIPDEEESPTAGISLGTARRGSFAVEPTSLAGIMREREAGNRRSISITPLMLSRLGDDSLDSAQAIRRLSRVE